VLYVILDRDSIFNADVIAFLEATGLKAKRTSVRLPGKTEPPKDGLGVAGARSSTISSRRTKNTFAIPESTIVQGAFGSHHGQGTYHQDRDGVVPFPAHDGKEEETLRRARRVRVVWLARRPFRLNGAALPGVARLHSRRASQTNLGEIGRISISRWAKSSDQSGPCRSIEPIGGFDAGGPGFGAHEN
jgi:hypothetical protein